MKELKPCHHCGCAEIGPLSQDECWELGGHRYECYSCGAHGPWRKTLEEAREAWNTRADGWVEVYDQGGFNGIKEGYYVCIDENEILPVIREAYTQFWYDEDSVEVVAFDEGVTHYIKQPLPEPPKGE